MKLMYKINLMPALSAVGPLVVLMVAWNAGNTSKDLLTKVETGYFPALEMSRNLSQTLLGIQRSLLDASTSADEDKLGDADELKVTFLEEIRAGRGNITIKSEELIILENSFSDYYNLARKTTERMIEGEMGEQIFLSLDEMKNKYNAIKDRLESSTHDKQLAMADAFLASNKSSGTLTTVIVLATAGGIAVLFLGIFWGRNVVKVIVDIMNMMKNLSQGEGDLTKRLQVNTNDETRELADFFNKFLDKLHALIFRLRSDAKEVSKAAIEIATAADQASAGATKQESQAGEVSVSVELMSSTIVEASQNASSAAESAKNAATSAEEGGKIVQQTLEGMRAISESVNHSAVTIGELGKRSDDIGEIIEVIDDIADQTNLLALNAAIEAARAGEQGRGFAVVADEVRKLAERTTKATAEIASMIKGIQEDTDNAVDAMKEGTRQVEEGSELALRAGESLSQIVQMSTEVQTMVEQIALAADEQSISVEQISSNVVSIATVTKQSAKGAEQMADSSEKLNKQTESLMALVGQFNISDQEFVDN